MLESMTAREFIEGDMGFGISWDGEADESGRTSPGLFVEFLQKCGIGPDDIVALEFEKVYPKDRVIPPEGWALFINDDDWTVAVYKDGKPVGGQYSSFRGELHQDGAYFVKDGQHLYAHNLPGVSGRSENVDVWEPVERTICSQIAEEFILGTGMFSPEGDEPTDVLLSGGVAE